jgi:hypothetical protein
LLGWVQTGFGLVKGLLTIYTHDSELQAITAPPLIATIHKSPQHPISHFQPAVFTSRSLATAYNSRDSFASSAQVLSSQPPVQNSLSNNSQLTLFMLITSRQGPRRNHSSSIVASNCCIINNLLPSNGNVFAEPLPRNGRCLQNHRLATGLYATISFT